MCYLKAGRRGATSLPSLGYKPHNNCRFRLALNVHIGSSKGKQSGEVRKTRTYRRKRRFLLDIGRPSAIVITLDPKDLASVGRARVTRAFTEVECLTYDIDPCPTTLEELRGG